MFALLPAGDADRRFTAMFVSGRRLELTEPVQLGESESKSESAVGVGETVRG